MQTVSDFILSRLAQWGIQRIYGYPGDGINGLIGAFGRTAEPLEFIQARHEETAAFMACAHAKFTGQVGVCMATSGPGAIHLLNGLYDAKLDHQPVVALVGQQARTAMGGDYQQEVDLVSLFKDVAHDFVHVASSPMQARHLVDRAIRIAMERRAVTCVILPNDVQDLPAVQPPREHATVHTGIGFTSHAGVPASTALQNAADILNKGERVAILAGAGAWGAGDELLQVADRLGAGVAKALLGKSVLPDNIPYVTGSIGLLGTQPSWRMMNECDTLLMVGTAFPYSEFLPEEGQARAVQIDRDGRMISLRYPVEQGLVGDSKATMQALLPLLRPRESHRWRDKIEKDVAQWWKTVEARAMVSARPMNPQRPFWELSRHLPDRSIITCDSGSAASWYAQHLRLRKGMSASLSGGLASMGSGVPYALAAKLAHPDRPVVALVGDGAMQMNGMNELITIAHRWRDWQDPTMVILVLNNGDLNMVTWEQRVMGGDPRFKDSQLLPAFPYADYAHLLGLEGIRVDDPEQVAGAWEHALASDRPVLLEMVVDPEVPPIPPHIPLKQVQNYIKALRQEDASGGAALRATLKQWWAG
ncbi:thiamine pyrophosphate-requiring protein [Bordetella petrii]|uniref:thiamine pyrophosphate-requiring protein n=1 Tax=Bordetella petrii TaxID=94624 RepID=UPI001E3DBDA7|nr:thiamine pyrophosphate-requiring protein [Bordetella petrii]MCD0504435.1 thiamine pyrophosphate-requiring protein [Bordetella petrii]